MEDKTIYVGAVELPPDRINSRRIHCSSTAYMVVACGRMHDPQMKKNNYRLLPYLSLGTQDNCSRVTLGHLPNEAGMRGNVGEMGGL